VSGVQFPQDPTGVVQVSRPAGTGVYITVEFRSSREERSVL